MSITTIPLLKGIASVGAAAAVGGSSYVVYQNSDAIKTFFTSGSSNTQHQEDTQEYVYFVVKNTTTPSTSETSLYDVSKKTKQFTCQFTKADGSKVQNSYCKIYKLSASDEHKTLINVKDTLSTTSSEITEKTSLSVNEHYLLKLPKTFADSLTAAEKNQIQIVDKNANENNVIASFTKVLDLSQEKQKVNKLVGQSNLFSVLITTASSATTFDADGSYKCKIASATSVPCKVYKLPDSYSSVAKTTLNASVAKISAQADVTAAKYVLVELTEGQKQLSELDGQVVIVEKTNETTVVATGLAEQLLVGSADITTATNNNLYIVSDSYPEIATGVISSTDKAYILTKGSDKLTLPAPATYSPTDYLCRVISENKKYDDEDCKLYAYPKSAATHFELSDYKSTASAAPTPIAAEADLAANKYQVIELKKDLQTALKKANASLHLVQKARKDKTINNKLINFTKVSNITDAAETPASLKSNLFLVRYKTARPTSNVSLASDVSLTCDVASLTGLSCKIYKFTTTKLENTLTKEEVKQLTAPTGTTDFADNSYLAIELVGVEKSTDDLKNQTFTLKNSATTISEFTFDQVIIGQAAAEGFALKPVVDSFIVKKPGTWTNTDGATSYRCKFTDANNQVNYDSSCKLSKITVDGGDTISTFANAKAVGAELNASNIGTVTDSYYKLTVNSNLLFNLSFDGSTPSLVEVELFKQDHASMGKLEIKQKFVADKFIGKTNLLLGKVVANNANLPGSLVGAKCNLDTSTTVVPDNQFACSLHKADNSTQPANKFTITAAAETTADATNFAKDKYFVIKLDEDKNISDFTDKTNIHYQIPTSEGATTFTSVDLKIMALMSGEIGNNKKPIFITQPLTA